MSNAAPKAVANMSEQEFDRALWEKPWLPKPEAAPVLSEEEIAIRRKIILNLPQEQFDMALQLKAWRS